MINLRATNNQIDLKSVKSMQQAQVAEEVQEPETPAARHGLTIVDDMETPDKVSPELLGFLKNVAKFLYVLLFVGLEYRRYSDGTTYANWR